MESIKEKKSKKKKSALIYLYRDLIICFHSEKFGSDFSTSLFSRYSCCCFQIESRRKKPLPSLLLIWFVIIHFFQFPLIVFLIPTVMWSLVFSVNSNFFFVLKSKKKINWNSSTMIIIKPGENYEFLQSFSIIDPYSSLKYFGDTHTHTQDMVGIHGHLKTFNFFFWNLILHFFLL